MNNLVQNVSLIVERSEAFNLTLHPAGPGVVCRVVSRQHRELLTISNNLLCNSFANATDQPLTPWRYDTIKIICTDTYQGTKVLFGQVRLTKRCTRLIARHLD